MGSKWYRFINGVFGVIYSFALGMLLFEVSFTEDDVAMFVVRDFLCVVCFVAATACFYQMYTGKDLFR
jgi:hypothetical protein